MNYPNQQPGYGTPRRKPNIFLLLMMGAMAMFLYAQYQKSQQQAALPEKPAPSMEGLRIPDFSNDGPRADGSVERPAPGGVAQNPGWNQRENQNNSGWEIDTDIPSKSSSTPSATKTYHADSSHDGVSKSGNWTLEQGDSTPGIDPNAKAVTPSQPKSTREGDWAIEEVETKK